MKSIDILRLIPPCALVLLGCTATVSAQIAKGATKYLGNISGSITVPSGFEDSWNRIGPETAGRWSSVEMGRDRMIWTGLDTVADFARREGIPWTMGPLLWGAGNPGWMTSIPKDSLTAEIEEWFTLAGARYPEVDMVVVINEQNVQHAPSHLFLNALGGKGTTGFDGLVNAFHLARQAFPKAKLIVNDYNTIEYAREHDTCLAMVKALLAAKAPIDGIGIQAHDAWRRPLDTLKKYLDAFASTGLPLHITEFDIPAADDRTQDSIMRSVFPLFWNHPRVAGITYYGIQVGRTWREGTGLIRTDHTERPALTWLRQYVKDNPAPPSPEQTSGAMARPISIRKPGMTLALQEGKLEIGLVHDGRFLLLKDLGLR